MSPVSYVSFGILLVAVCCNICCASPSEVLAVVGRNATLKCPNVATESHEEYRMAWIKMNTRTILSLRGELVTQNSRYGIKKQQRGLYDLEIMNVAESDAGVYICQITSSPMLNMEINLVVGRSPYFTRNMTVTVRVQEGHDTELKCLADGIPKPTISWQKKTSPGNYQTIAGPNINDLRLKRMRIEDSGSYICIAKNGHLPHISHTFQVVVMHKPKILVAQQMHSRRIGDIEVSCQVTAIPQPKLFEIRPLKGHDLQVVSEKKKSNESFNTYQLDIVARSNSRRSKFECIAENSLGRVVKAIVAKSKRSFHVTSSPQMSSRNYYEMKATTFKTSPLRHIEPTTTTSSDIITFVQTEDYLEVDNNAIGRSKNSFVLGLILLLVIKFL